jgi:hypothetical protein
MMFVTAVMILHKKKKKSVNKDQPFSCEQHVIVKAPLPSKKSVSVNNFEIKINAWKDSPHLLRFQKYYWFSVLHPILADVFDDLH